MVFERSIASPIPPTTSKAPAIVSGNAAVVISSETRPLPAVTLTEVLATSDVPGGVVNLITGLRRELVGHLASHMDVNALDAFGADPSGAAALEVAAVDNVKRFVRPPSAGRLSPSTSPRSTLPWPASCCAK